MSEIAKENQRTGVITIAARENYSSKLISSQWKNGGRIHKR